MNPKVSIIIVNWNTGDLLRECIKSVKDTFYVDDSLTAEILVIDNASNDYSIQMAKSAYSDIRVIEVDKNIGFGLANNLASRKASGDYLLFLNPDTVVKAGSIQLLVDHLALHPEVAVVGPKLLNPDGSMQTSIFRTLTLAREAWRLFHLDYILPYNSYPSRILESKGPQVVDILKGACILIRREIFFATGMFDERFFMFTEEFDLCVRVRSAGWKIHWVPEALVVHLGGQSTKLVADRMFLMLYRSKIEFFRKYYGYPSTTLYKLLLYLASLIRYIPGLLLKDSRLIWSQTLWGASRQYGLLLHEIRYF